MSIRRKLVVTFVFEGEGLDVSVGRKSDVVSVEKVSGRGVSCGGLGFVSTSTRSFEGLPFPPRSRRIDFRILVFPFVRWSPTDETKKTSVLNIVLTKIQ